MQCAAAACRHEEPQSSDLAVCILLAVHEPDQVRLPTKRRKRSYVKVRPRWLHRQQERPREPPRFVLGPRIAQEPLLREIPGVLINRRGDGTDELLESYLGIGLLRQPLQGLVRGQFLELQRPVEETGTPLAGQLRTLGRLAGFELDVATEHVKQSAKLGGARHRLPHRTKELPISDAHCQDALHRRQRLGQFGVVVDGIN